MASAIARAYVNMINAGKRKLDDVKPDKLKDEVRELLVYTDKESEAEGVENGK